MAVARSHEGRSQVIPQQRNVRGVRAVGDGERAAGAVARIGWALHSREIDVRERSIVSWPDIPATVPEKLDESSSLRVPVSPRNVACLSTAELISTVAPGATASETFALGGDAAARFMLELDARGAP